MATSEWIGGSGDWADPGNWSNGIPNDSNAVADFDGSNSYTATIAGRLDGDPTESFTVGTLDISNPNASLDIDGTLNVASVIDISAGTLSLAGAIVGGTIKQTGGTIVFSHIGPDWTGTLDGVTIQGTLDLSAGYSVNLKDGLTVTGANGTGPGIVNDTGAGSTLNFYGTQTFDNANINMGGSGFSSYLNAWDENDTAATLTLGPNVTINTPGTSTFDGSADATIVNQGTIVAETDGKNLSIYDVSFVNQGMIEVTNDEQLVVDAANFTNTGTIDVGERSTLEFSTNLVASQLGNIQVNNGFIWFKGTVDNTRNLLTVGIGSALGVVSVYNMITGGTIKDVGGGLNFIGNNAGLVDVTYRGTLGIDEGGFMVTGGLRLRNLAGNGAGELDIYGGQVIFQGAQSLNNATLRLGYGEVTGSIDAELATGASSGTLTFGAGLSVLAGPYASIGGTEKVVNRGSIVAQGNGQFTISSASFVNQGAIVLAGGETMLVSTGFTNNGSVEVIQGLLDLQKAAGGTGNYQIDASGKLEFDSGVGAGLYLHFYGTGGTLEVAAANAFKAGAIAGFAAGDTIDLANVAFNGSTTLRYTGTTAGGTLIVSDGTHTAKLNLVGDFAGQSFAFTSDGASGTAITYTGSTGGDAALHSKLRQFTSALAAHSADGAFSAPHAGHAQREPAHAAVLAASWHH